MNRGPSSSLIYFSFQPCNLPSFMQNPPRLTQEQAVEKRIKFQTEIMCMTVKNLLIEFVKTFFLILY